MTLSHLNRRLHLYLGLTLLPWLFMYGLSSIPFAHNGFFQQRDAATGLPLWTVRAEGTFDAPVPDNPEALRALGGALLADAGIRDLSYGVYRPNATQVNVFAFTFWEHTRIIYTPAKQQYRVEDRRFRWDQFLTGLHARGGFDQDRAFVRSWSVVVDVVQVAILLWIATGLVMWWPLRGHRLWGLLAIAAGTVSFVIFTLRL
jgi:hypothetical protein